MQTNQVQVRQDYVIQAFQAINNPVVNTTNVQLANNYLFSCQQSSVNFPILLLQLFVSSSNKLIQLQSLLLFGNIIKRNWSNKRGKSKEGFQSIKGQLKIGILQAYKQKGSNYIKHMNQILKYISNFEYPTAYPQLHNFMLEGLQNINNLIQNGATQILKSSKVILNLLSTIKAVIKQYSQKKITMDKETFLQKIAIIIQSLLKIDQIIRNFLQSFQIQKDHLETMAQIARKIDKIVLYGILSMTTALQTNTDVQALFYKFLTKMELYENLWTSAKASRSIIQFNLLAILQLAGCIQEKYPLFFTQFLGEYFSLIKHCLDKAKNRENQRLIATSIKNIYMICTSYAYYTNPAQYVSYTRTSTNRQMQAGLQKKCYDVFSNFFVQQNLNSIVNEIIQLMKHYPSRKQENELLFEDLDPVALDNDLTIYEQCLKLVQRLLSFHKAFGKKLIQNFIRMSQQNTNSVILIDIISIVPKVYSNQEMPIQQIMKLLQILYQQKSYELFAKLIKSVQQCLKYQDARQCFAILIQIVNKQEVVEPQTLYQIFLTIKKIMITYDGYNMIEGFDLSNVFMKLLLLHRIYISNSVLIWPLVNLTNQMLKCLSSNIIEALLPNVISCLQPLLSSKEQLVVNPLSQLFLMLLEKPMKVQSKFLHKMLALIANNIQNQKLQSTFNIFKLWIEIIRQFPTSKQQQVSNQIIFDFKMCFEKYGHVIQEDSPQLYLQLIQDYMLAGLLEIDISKINQLFTKLMENQTELAAHNCRISRGMFSLYYSYCIGANACYQQWLSKIMKQLKYFHNCISPLYNSLRALLLQIFHYHILKLSAQTVYRTLACEFKDYKEWFQPYYWSLEYVQNKYTWKMNALGILQSLSLMETQGILSNKIENNYPFDTIFKVLVYELKPIKQQIGISGLLQIYQIKESNINLERIPRKILHQFSKEVCQKDLRPIFGGQMSQILKKWDWGMDDLQQRFSEGTVQKIVEIIEGKYKQGQLQIGDLR